MKEIKLTETQEKAYNKMLEKLRIAKESENAKEYYFKMYVEEFKDRPDYQSIVDHEEKKWEAINGEQLYKPTFENAKYNNIVLIIASSSTLRALEKRV